MIKSAGCSVAGLCLGMTLLAACEKAPVEKSEVVRPVRIFTISGLGAGDSLEFPGEIAGVQNADLAFEVAGRLIELPIKEGVNVTQNQLLARLDPTDFQASLDAAEARFRQSKETFERFSEVFEKGAISRQELNDRIGRQIDGHLTFLKVCWQVYSHRCRHARQYFDVARRIEPRPCFERAGHRVRRCCDFRDYCRESPAGNR